MPSSAQLELAAYYLVASWLILTHLAYADTAYFTNFSCGAELQPRNKLSRVGGWVGGWVAGWLGGRLRKAGNKVELSKLGLAVG